MKIECTEEQKQLIIDMLLKADNCLFADGICYGFSYCEKCLNERIEWEITES